MDKTERIKKLKELLKKSNALNEIYKSKDFQDHLLPYLKELSYVQHIDPSLFKEEKEFDYALKIANLRASVYGDLIKFLEQQEGMIKKINEAIELPDKNFEI